MFRANDINGNSVYIDDADKNDKYFCPVCDEPLILKRGTRKKPHFAHFPNTICKDNWHYEPMSDWHLSWQNWFNKENREVWIKGENESHRADISIGNIIIEFQHSHISNTEFDKRNKFYTSCNKGVIWIFDMKNQITLNDDGTFNWEKKNSFENTFIDYINYNNKVMVYFEIENDILIQIEDFSEKRYLKFKTFNYNIVALNFLKDFVDLSVYEQFIGQKILSISELFRIDSNNLNMLKNRRVAILRSPTRTYNGYSGPKERLLFKNEQKTKKNNYKKSNYKKRR
ncbi:MAG: hypothetical protein IJY65_03115 [Clostridia bacterium]|nr:hypothetical protein [Clostridia bacterium]